MRIILLESYTIEVNMPKATTKSEQGHLVVGGAELPVITNAAVLYTERLAGAGKRTMQSTLQHIAKQLGVPSWRQVAWHTLTYEHVAAIRRWLVNAKTREGLPKYKPATINKYLAALRGVAREAWRNNMMTTEQYMRLKDVESVNGETLPAGRALGMGELEALMRTCKADRTAAGRRDAAIIALAYAGGLRRAELASLTMQSITADDGETVTLKVLGKRLKERLIYLDNGSAAALRAWLKVRGLGDGALFYAGRKGGHIVTGQGMSAQAVRDIIDRRAREAGIQHASPHDFRRAFISDLLDAGVDIATVAKMAGHESVQTTARYDRRGEYAKQRAARALHVPYYE